MNLSERWATRQGRIRIILIAIILATIPCYCAGLIILMIDPKTAGEEGTPTVKTETGTKVVSPTSTPPTLVYFQSPTVTQTGTITPTPKASRTYALPPSLTPTLTPVPTDTATLEPTLTEMPSLTMTIPIPDTDTPIPTP